MKLPAKLTVHGEHRAVDVADQAVADNDVGDFPVAAFPDIPQTGEPGHARGFGSRADSATPGRRVQSIPRWPCRPSCSTVVTAEPVTGHDIPNPPLDQFTLAATHPGGSSLRRLAMILSTIRLGSTRGDQVPHRIRRDLVAHLGMRPRSGPRRSRSAIFSGGSPISPRCSMNLRTFSSAGKIRRVLVGAKCRPPRPCPRSASSPRPARR